MGRRLKDITDRTFGRWTVIGLHHRGESTGKQSVWLCRCSCGNEKTLRRSNLINGVSKSCGCLRDELAAEKGRALFGPNHPKWKGGRSLDLDGYVRVWKRGHPKADNNRYVKEHVLVMEEIVGRFLFPLETVHHKNGVKDDNRPENLELWSKSHPPGQRVDDKVAWAKEILVSYQSQEQIEEWVDGLDKNQKRCEAEESYHIGGLG